MVREQRLGATGVAHPRVLAWRSLHPDELAGRRRRRRRSRASRGSRSCDGGRSSGRPGRRRFPRAWEGAPPDGRPCAMEGPGVTLGGLSPPRLWCWSPGVWCTTRCPTRSRPCGTPASGRSRSSRTCRTPSSSARSTRSCPRWSGTSRTSPPTRTSGSATATAASRCCTPTSPRRTTPSRRPARCAARSSCSTPPAPAATSPTCARARSPSWPGTGSTRSCTSSCCATSSSTPRRCARR